jgi:sugar/nucleoside kinase (ribokinase family)
MAERSGILTAGSLILDRIYAIPDWPSEETVVEIAGEDAQGGGPGFNMAVDLRRLRPSLTVEVIGMVGDDADGDFLRAGLERDGVGTGGLHASTALTLVMTSMATGRRTFFSNQGADALLAPEHFDFSKTGCRIVHLGLPGIMRTLDAAAPPDDNGWVSVLKRAGAAGLKRNMEICSIPAETIARIGRPCLPHLDYLVINDFEIGALAGIPTTPSGATDIEAVRRACRAVMEMGSMELVVVHFPKGAIGLTRDGRLVEQPSVRVPKEAIKGSNGAGDAFAAGVLLTLHDGGDLSEALKLGHAVAAASLRSLTTVGSVESEAACRALCEQWGWRESIA